MAQILVRKLSEKTVDKLKLLAEQHHRSLQAEVRQILTNVAEVASNEPYKVAMKIRNKLAKDKHSDSAKLIATDRQR